MHAGQTATENDAPSAAAPHALAAAPVLPEYYLSQLTFVCIYALVGMGLMLLTGDTGQISLGHGAFLAVGAYTEAVSNRSASARFSSTPNGSSITSRWITAPAKRRRAV